MPNKITSWLKSHVTQYKIDFMSLNRLRLNQTVSGQIPVTISLTEKTRMAENLLWARSHDASTSFESMELLLNPYGITPLTALCMFHTDTRCRLSYTVVSDFCVPWHYDSMTYTTNHVLPVFGLCENTDNIITLTLYDESNQPIKNREITLHTGTLSETNHYPCVQDKQGMYRYFLSLPAKDDNLIPLSDGHFLIVHPDYLVKTEQGLLPTHIYEVDLLGRCYRTYYVGDGIFDVYGEISAENKNLLVLSSDAKKGDKLLLEINRETGAIQHIYSPYEREVTSPATHLKQEFFESVISDSLEQFSHFGECLEKIEFPVVGWLKAPGFYKAASVETSSATDLEFMKNTYGITFSINGDSLLVNTTGDLIQEIVFSHPDRIYQLDLTNPPLDESLYEKYRYTLTVPLTEMYSGTYSLVIRFRDGKQEVLQDALSLSRRRNNEN